MFVKSYEAGVPARFTKILLTRDYYDGFLKERYGADYANRKEALHFGQQAHPGGLPRAFGFNRSGP